jgi:hypothetical protein
MVSSVGLGMGYSYGDMDHVARLNLKLAQRHYQARVIELRSLILAEEERFKYGLLFPVWTSLIPSIVEHWRPR